MSSAWKIDGSAFELAVEIPSNTTAMIRLPGARLADVKEGGLALSAAAGVGPPRQDGPDVVFEAGSGLYRFAYTPAK